MNSNFEDEHFRWIGIIADRIICAKNPENELPLLSLSFLDANNLSTYSSFTRPTFPITIKDLLDAKLYGIIVSAIIFNKKRNIINCEFNFDSILNDLSNEGYIPQKPCDSSGLKEGIAENHVNLCKSIEFLVADRSINVELLTTDLRHLPRSFFVLKSDIQIDLLEDAVALWLAKFHCNCHFDDEVEQLNSNCEDQKDNIFNLNSKNYIIQRDTSKFSKVAACLARIFPKQINKNDIKKGENEEEIQSNINLSKIILDELHAFVVEKLPNDEHLFMLFISDLYYATRSGVKKFVKVDQPPLTKISTLPPTVLQLQNSNLTNLQPITIKKSLSSISDLNQVKEKPKQHLLSNPLIQKNKSSQSKLQPTILKPKVEQNFSINPKNANKKKQESPKSAKKLGPIGNKKSSLNSKTRRCILEFPEIEILLKKLIEKYPQKEGIYKKHYDGFMQVIQEATSRNSPATSEIIRVAKLYFEQLLNGQQEPQFELERKLLGILEKYSPADKQNDTEIDSKSGESCGLESRNSNGTKTSAKSSIGDANNEVIAGNEHAECEGLKLPELAEDPGFEEDEEDSENDGASNKGANKSNGSNANNGSFDASNNRDSSMKVSDANARTKLLELAENADIDEEEEDESSNRRSRKRGKDRKINREDESGDRVSNYDDSSNSKNAKSSSNLNYNNESDRSNIKSSYDMGLSSNESGSSGSQNGGSIGALNSAISTGINDASINNNVTNSSLNNEESANGNDVDNGSLDASSNRDSSMKVSDANEKIKLLELAENADMDEEEEEEDESSNRRSRKRGKDRKGNRENESGDSTSDYDDSSNNKGNNINDENANDNDEEGSLNKNNKGNNINDGNANNNDEEGSLNKNNKGNNFNDGNANNNDEEGSLNNNESNNFNDGNNNKDDDNEELKTEVEEMTDEMILREAEKLSSQNFRGKFKRFSRPSRTKATAAKHPSTVPNYQTIVNALRFNSLPGPKYTKLVESIVEIMKDFKDERFVLLMASRTQKFKGIYILSSEGLTAQKLWGEGPSEVKNENISIFYKYINGQKKFDVISVKSFTQTTDGFSLKKKLEHESW